MLDHHSFGAEYDANKPITLTGTVTKVEWTNPHSFFYLDVKDASGKVVYNGAIDDKRSTDVADVKVARNYVVAALDEMKAGKPVSTASTTPYGCTIKYR